MQAILKLHFFSSLLIINLFLGRPAALGQSFQALSMLIAVALVCLHAVLYGLNSNICDPRLKNEMKWFWALFLAYWIYSITISLIFQKSNLEYVLKDLLSTTIIAASYAYFLTDTKTNHNFFRQLCLTIAIIGWSSLATTVLALIVGIEKLYITSVEIGGYSDLAADNLLASGAIYFPFSMLYGEFTPDGLELFRFNGFFRESGIYQAIACFCLAYEIFNRKSKLVILGLTAGVLCSLSSIGIVLLFATYALTLTFRRGISIYRILLITAVLFLSYPIAMYTPYIGLEAKSVTHGTTISDRTNAVEKGLEFFSRNILGYGLFSNFEKNSGINMIASIGATGLFGFICQFILLSGYRFEKIKFAVHKMICCMPLLITALISQPIAAAPSINVLLMAFVPFYQRQRGILNAATSNFPSLQTIRPSAPKSNQLTSHI